MIDSTLLINTIENAKNPSYEMLHNAVSICDQKKRSTVKLFLITGWHSEHNNRDPDKTTACFGVNSRRL